jgi:hypothetical protein
MDTPLFSHVNINTFGNGVNLINFNDGTEDNPIQTSPVASASASASAASVIAAAWVHL